MRRTAAPATPGQKSEWRPATDQAYRLEHRIDPFSGEEDESEHHPYWMGRPKRERAEPDTEKALGTAGRGGQAGARARGHRNRRRGTVTRASAMATTNPTTTRLTRLFGDLNQQFFRGRLPAYRIQFARFEIPGKCGERDTARRMIRLSRRLQDDPAGWRQAMLHEMCHIGAPWHGRRFQAKLAKLAAAGEAWAETLR